MDIALVVVLSLCGVVLLGVIGSVIYDCGRASLRESIRKAEEEKRQEEFERLDAEEAKKRWLAAYEKWPRYTRTTVCPACGSGSADQEMWSCMESGMPPNLAIECKICKQRFRRKHRAKDEKALMGIDWKAPHA